MARGCWQTLVTPVHASHKAVSTRRSKNNIKWWEILPSSDKEIQVLKNSFNFWLRPRKKNSIRKKYRVIFTYRRRCMLRDRTIFVQNQLLCLQARLSDWPTYLFTIFVSSYRHFSVNTSCSKLFHSITLNQYYAQALCDQKKSLQCFVQRISRAYPGI